MHVADRYDCEWHDMANYDLRVWALLLALFAMLCDETCQTWPLLLANMNVNDLAL